MRLRILFEADGKLRSFYWFECTGEDIYWGYSGKLSHRLSKSFDGLSVTISPNRNPLEEITHAKMSYHKSGEFHEKIRKKDGSSRYESVMKWRAMQRIDKPFRIMALFTMPPMNYGIYKGSPTRGRSQVAIIQFNGQSMKTRKYVEFFIAPEGTFAVPEPLIPTSKTTDKPEPMSIYFLSDKYALLIRMLGFPSDHDLDTWHPDKEILIYTEDKEKF